MLGDFEGLRSGGEGDYINPEVLGVGRGGMQGKLILWAGVQDLWGGDLRAPLSPTIFNLMVDAIVREWIRKLKEGGIGTEDTRQLVACF